MSCLSFSFEAKVEVVVYLAENLNNKNNSRHNIQVFWKGHKSLEISFTYVKSKWKITSNWNFYGLLWKPEVYQTSVWCRESNALSFFRAKPILNLSINSFFLDLYCFRSVMIVLDRSRIGLQFGPGPKRSFH